MKSILTLFSVFLLLAGALGMTSCASSDDPPSILATASALEGTWRSDMHSDAPTDDQHALVLNRITPMGASVGFEACEPTVDKPDATYKTWTEIYITSSGITGLAMRQVKVHQFRQQGDEPACGLNNGDGKEYMLFLHENGAFLLDQTFNLSLKANDDQLVVTFAAAVSLSPSEANGLLMAPPPRTEWAANLLDVPEGVAWLAGSWSSYGVGAGTQLSWVPDSRTLSISMAHHIGGGDSSIEFSDGKPEEGATCQVSLETPTAHMTAFEFIFTNGKYALEESESNAPQCAEYISALNGSADGKAGEYRIAYVKSPADAEVTADTRLQIFGATSLRKDGLDSDSDN